MCKQYKQVGSRELVTSSAKGGKSGEGDGWEQGDKKEGRP